MNALETRYRWLLRAYPAWYRQDRAEEMLDTLLEAAGAGRTWPSARDARTLILGGLRVRAWPDQRQSPAASLCAAALLAAVLTLIVGSSLYLGMVRGEWGYTFPSMLRSWVNLALGLLTAAAAAGAWFGHRAVTAVTALAAAALWVYQPPGLDWARAIVPVLALAVIAILAVIRRERLPRSWLWLAGTVFAAFLLPRLFPPFDLPHVAYLAALGVLGVTIVWSLVDARPMAATAIWLAVTFGADSIQLFARNGLRIYLWGWWLPAIIATVAAIAGIWRLRRQAIL
jgi:hypothetical protein